ncbi:MAG: restriction endonuclease subunit S [Muribaculaceae bacterium]|nr:restriction endonuclease subunit S [Muribaculaceae bacterium]MBJ2193305.1 restriction endonuclease subunit S [Muribaculaceae bacterium]
MALSPSASYKSHYQQFTPPFEIPKSWQWVNITEVTSKITDGTHHSPENKPIGDFLYITAKNIKYDGIKKDSATYVNSNVHTEIYSRCNPEYGDILYIKDGATAGVVAINDLKVPFSLLSSVALIKPLGILNRYLYYFLRSDFSNSSIKKSMKGVGITRITLRQIEEWNIPVPPYAEQERIVKILDNYFSMLSYLEWNIDTLQESIHNAKSKILDLAMQGKLVPQDPADEPAADMLRRINPEAKIITDNPHYPQLPDNWVLTKLGDVVKVINGKSQKEVENPSGAYPIYGSGGVIGKADAYSCLSGSTIIGRKGTINNPQFIETNFWNVDTAFGMKPYEAVNDLYFYYFCKSFDFTSLDKSSTLPSLTKTAIEGILMPTPPLGEQRRIILKIKEYDELFRNIFTQIGQK